MTKAERLEALTGKASGQLVTIDRGVLGELVGRFAEAVGAVERANDRAAGVKRVWSCVSAVFSTGTPAAGCLADKPAR